MRSAIFLSQGPELNRSTCEECHEVCWIADFCSCSDDGLCGSCGFGRSAGCNKAGLFEYESAGRAAGCRPSTPDDAGGEGHAAPEPSARDSATERARVRLVERGTAWRGDE